MNGTTDGTPPAADELADLAILSPDIADDALEAAASGATRTVVLQTAVSSAAICC